MYYYGMLPVPVLRAPLNMQLTPANIKPRLKQGFHICYMQKLKQAQDAQNVNTLS